jgi:hypothetical protein
VIDALAEITHTRLEVVLPSRVPADRLNYLQELIQSCRDNLRQEPGPWKGVDEEMASRYLAALVLERATRRSRRLGGETTEARIRLVRPERVRLELLALAAGAWGTDLTQLAADASALREALQAVVDFEAAVAPRKLTSVFYGSLSGRDRFSVFLKRGETPPGVLRDTARRTLLDAGLTDGEAERLLNKLRPEWLRTYAADHVARMAGHFRLWDPLVRLLSGDPSVASDPEAEARLTELLGGLREQLSRRWRDPWAAEEIQDVEGEALLAALASVDEPGRGYCYEGTLPAWLAQTARTMLKSRAPAPGGDDSEPADAEDRVGRVVDDVSAAQRESVYREWYALIETYFRKKGRARVKEIWERTLQHDETRDEDLAMLLMRTTGEPTKPSTVAVIRRRVRQRLGAIRYVLEIGSAEEDDEPGDVSMLRYIKTQHGWSDKDVPTLRSLAGFARALRGRGGPQVGVRAREILDLGAGVGPGSAPTLHGLGEEDRRRLARGAAWIADPGNWKLYRRVIGQATREGILFLLEPCWCLTVMCEEGPDVIVELLNPAGPERSPLRNIATILGKRTRG